jgi:hypothetical protein
MQRAALGWCRSLAFAYDPRVDAAGRTGVGEAPDEDLHVAGRCHDAGPGDGAGGHCLRWRDVIAWLKEAKVEAVELRKADAAR